MTFQEKGTFQEFNNAIAPRARYYYFDHSMRKSAPNPFRTAEGLIGQELSIIDVLSRIPTLHKTFTRTYGHQTKCMLLTSHSSSGIITTLRVDDPFLATDRAKLVELITRLRTDYPFLKEWRLDSVSIAWDNSIVEFDNARYDYDDVSPEMLPQLQNGSFQCISRAHSQFADPITILPPMAGGFDRNAYGWAIQPIGDVILNEYSLQFLGAFMLGSLVRYRPQIWQHALSKSATQQWPADDRSLSLIEQFIDDVLSSFPKLVVGLLDSSSSY